jgi:putative FmdB family regulatory protein
MPIFEYVCGDCSSRFELIVRGPETPHCPSCESDNLQKQLSVFAVGQGGARPQAAPGPCGTCGDPRGPGSCSLN